MYDLSPRTTTDELVYQGIDANDISASFRGPSHEILVRKPQAEARGSGNTARVHRLVEQRVTG
jgi:hypothetical protein